MCSSHIRLNLVAIYECVILTTWVSSNKQKYGPQMLDWLVTRKIKLSSLQLLCSLPKSVGTKITALLSHSKHHLLGLDVHNDACALGPLVACISRFCSQIMILQTRNYKLNESFFMMLGSLRNLKRFCMSDCTAILTEHCNGIHCPSVENLTIDGKYTAEVQRAVLNMFPNIAKLHLVHGDNVDLSKMPVTVELLIIFGCTQISAWTLSETIYFIRIYNSGLRDEHVAQIIEKCPYSEYIDVGYNKLLSEAAIRSISDAYNVNLRGLEIAGCTRMSLAGLQYAISKCKYLLILDISQLKNTTIQSAVFDTIAETCTSLKHLATNGNVLSDYALGRIAQMSLEKLSMVATYGYSELGVLALVTGCLQLKEIVIDNALVTGSPLVKLLWHDKRPLLKIAYAYE